VNREKFSSREKSETASVPAGSGGANAFAGPKRTITQRQTTLRISLKFTICPQEKRAEYVEALDRMIRRVEKVINSARTTTSQRLRAMTVLAELVRVSYSMVRDVDVERLEREVKALEAAKGGAAAGPGAPE